MSNLRPFLVMFTAFVVGAFVCEFPTWKELSSTAVPILPDRSVVPRSDVASVEASYDAIPHRRTVFPGRATWIADHEADYLEVMFEVVDQAIVVRVDALRQIAAGRSLADTVVAYDALIDCAGSIGAPSSLREYHETIRDALVKQRAVIQSLHRQAVLETNSLRIDVLPGTRKSSAQLKKAYSILMKKFPAASQQAQEAFFDYHCALDFI